MKIKIQVKEVVKTNDKIFTFRPWVGKMIGFFTVKIAPKPLSNTPKKK